MAPRAKQRKDEGSARSPSSRLGRPLKRKSCQLCRHHVTQVDYKDVGLLRGYLSDRGKIRPRRMSGACRRHQRLVAVAVKRAREMALLPYVAAGGVAAVRPRSGPSR